LSHGAARAYRPHKPSSRRPGPPAAVWCDFVGEVLCAPCYPSCQLLAQPRPTVPSLQGPLSGTGKARLYGRYGRDLAVSGMTAFETESVESCRRIFVASRSFRSGRNVPRAAIVGSCTTGVAQTRLNTSPERLWRPPEPVLLEQEQCRDGFALPVEARACVRLQGRQRAAFAGCSRKWMSRRGRPT
jgi:hypothetical protein